MIDVTAVREPDGEAVRLPQVTEGADATVSGDIHPMVECAIGAACNETYVVTMELLSSTVDRLDVTLACLFYPGNVKVPPGAGETLSISD